MDSQNMKALYIVVNTGFAEKIVDLALTNGASGATIINARGICMTHKQVMGISADTEKEVVLILTDEPTAKRIMEAVHNYAGFKTHAHGICFCIALERVVGLRPCAVPANENSNERD